MLQGKKEPKLYILQNLGTIDLDYSGIIQCFILAVHTWGKKSKQIVPNLEVFEPSQLNISNFSGCIHAMQVR